MEAPKGESNRQKLLTERKSSKPRKAKWLKSAGCTKVKSVGSTKVQREPAAKESKVAQEPAAKEGKVLATAISEQPAAKEGKAAQECRKHERKHSGCRIDEGLSRCLVPRRADCCLKGKRCDHGMAKTNNVVGGMGNGWHQTMGTVKDIRAARLKH